MKKSALLIIMVILALPVRIYCQSIPTFPIPSYNVVVKDYTNFSGGIGSLDSCKLTLEKRQIIVRVSSVPIGNPDCNATVWVYSIDQTTILGPYLIDCGEVLRVDIDEREWGVFVESDYEITVDVWIEELI